MRLVLFDFDGTITYGDSFIQFIKFIYGERYFYLKLLGIVHLIFMYYLRIYPASKLKERFVYEFFKGISEEEFARLGQKFCKTHLTNFLKPKAVQKIKEHIKKNDTIYIVTASNRFWISPWAEEYNIKVIGTNYELESGVLTGKLSGKNCKGVEKVKRIKQEIDLSRFDQIIAYGNSNGDKEMMDIAHERYYKVF